LCRMRESALGAYMDELARQLSEQGYARVNRPGIPGDSIF
jgi:hypothetical protein